MPFLHILGGANGTGKSTYYEVAVSEGTLDPDLPFINVDMVAKKELGSYSTTNLLIAEELVKQ